MVKKIPKDNITIHKISTLSNEEILKADLRNHCFGIKEQWVIDDDDILVGFIPVDNNGSSCLDNINKDYVHIVRNKYEIEMAESVFNKSSHIYSIPVLDDAGHILYFYVELNEGEAKYEEMNSVESLIQGMDELPEALRRIENTYKKNVHIYTDVSVGCFPENVKDVILNHSAISELDSSKDIVVLVYRYDFNVWDFVNSLILRRISFIPYNLSRKNMRLEVSPYYATDKYAKKVLDEELLLNGNYFDLYDFQNIFQAIKLTKGIDGDYVEIGTYRGDSARAALSYSEKLEINRNFYFIDTFEGFSYTEAKDSADIGWANTHHETSMNLVEARLKEFKNWKLVKSNIISDGLPRNLNRIAVCNIDVDLYEAVQASLIAVDKKIVNGGVILAEDYGHTPALIGAQIAINEFYEKNSERYYGLYLQSGQFLLIRR